MAKTIRLSTEDAQTMLAQASRNRGRGHYQKTHGRKWFPRDLVLYRGIFYLIADLDAEGSGSTATLLDAYRDGRTLVRGVDFGQLEFRG